MVQIYYKNLDQQVSKCDKGFVISELIIQGRIMHITLD